MIVDIVGSSCVRVDPARSLVAPAARTTSEAAPVRDPGFPGSRAATRCATMRDHGARRRPSRDRRPSRTGRPSERSRSSLALATVGALAFAVLTSPVGAASGAPPQFLVLDATIGAVYIGCGRHRVAAAAGGPDRAAARRLRGAQLRRQLRPDAADPVRHPPRVRIRGLLRRRAGGPRARPAGAPADGLGTLARRSRCSARSSSAAPRGCSSRTRPVAPGRRPAAEPVRDRGDRRTRSSPSRPSASAAIASLALAVALVCLRRLVAAGRSSAT